MSDNEIESDEVIDDIDSEYNDESSFTDNKVLSRDKMEYKRKLEEYLENKGLEDELNNY